MRKKFSAVLLALAALCCNGCSESSPRKDGYDSRSTYSYDPSPTHSDPYPSSTPQSSSYSDTYNSYYNDDYYDDITYEDYLYMYRDEVISEAESVTYQQLARSLDGMEGEFIKVKGQIIQAFDDGDYIIGMIAITDLGYDYYDDLIMFTIPKDFITTRPIEDDIAIMWGIATGFTTYESALGNIRTEPSIGVAKIQVTGKVRY